MSTVGSLMMYLGLDSKQFSTGIKTAEAETDGLGGHLKGLAGAGAVLAVGAIGAEAIHMATNFQEATASIATGAGITQKAADDIGKAFLKTAGISTFSAKEMADAYGPVAGRLGEVEGHALSAGEAIKFMAAATDLAEASGRDLASSTSALTDIMRAYRLSAGDASSASDVLYNTSRLTGAGFEEIVKGGGKMRAVLGEAAPDINTLGGLLVSLSDKGIKGSRGLMMVTSGLDALYKGSPTTAAELKKLGVTVLDVHGNFLPLASVIDQLQPRLEKMSPAQREATLEALGLGKAAQALGAVFLEGNKGLQAHIDAVSKLDSAHAAAELKAATLAGAQKKLKAAFDDAMVTIGLKMLPALATLAEKALPLVTQASGWLADHLEIVAKVIGGAVLLAIGAYTISMASAAVATIAATWPILLIIAGIAALVAGFIWAYNHLTGFRKAIDSLVQTATHLGPLFKALVAPITAAWGAISGAVGKAMAALQHFVQPVLDGMSAWWQKHGEQVVAVVNFLWTAVTTYFRVGFALISGIVQTVWPIITAYFSVAWAVITNVLKVGWDVVAGIFKLAFDIITGVVKVAWDLISGIFTVALDVITGHWAQAWDDVKGTFFTVAADILNAVSGFTTDLLNFLTGLVGDIAKGAAAIGKAIVDGIISGLRGAWEGLLSMARGLLNALPGPLKSVLGISSPSKVFAEQIGMPIAHGIAAGITAGTGAIQAALAAVTAVPQAQQALGLARAGLAGQPQAGVGGTARGARAQERSGPGQVLIEKVEVNYPRTELDIARAMETHLYAATLKARGFGPSKHAR